MANNTAANPGKIFSCKKLPDTIAVLLNTYVIYLLVIITLNYDSYIRSYLSVHLILGYVVRRLLLHNQVIRKKIDK